MSWTRPCSPSCSKAAEQAASPAAVGRITALVVRDPEKVLRLHLEQGGFTLTLTGPAGGSWAFGPRPDQAGIRMDALDFHVLASGRAGAAEMVSPGKASFSGGKAVARQMLDRFAVPY